MVGYPQHIFMKYHIRQKSGECSPSGSESSLESHSLTTGHKHTSDGSPKTHHEPYMIRDKVDYNELIKGEE